MSSRVTRSSAKKSADTNPASNNPFEESQPSAGASLQRFPPPSSRKRTAASRNSPSPETETLLHQTSRRSKRPRYTEPEDSLVSTPPSFASKGKGRAVMSTPKDSAQDPLEENIPSPPTTVSSSKRKTAKSKKSSPNQSRGSSSHPSKHSSASSTKGGASSAKPTSDNQEAIPKGGPMTEEEDVHMSEGEDNDNEQEPPGDHAHDFEEDDDMAEDPFEASLFAHRHAAAGLSGTLRALSGFMGGGGSSSRFAQILENLRRKDDPDVQMMALEELSNLLLMSTEDALAGRFSPEQFVKEIVPLMQPTDFGENPVMMLVACRCIANLIEALPAATTTVVYSGAVPALLGHLIAVTDLEISEQALITLEKISAEFPRSIVSEGGLAPCLSNLDFYTSSIQRTAVTIAANCSRNLQPDAFSSVRDVMPKLLEVLSANTDQKVVEQACLAISRIVESYKEQDEKIEELMTPELLQAILRMILPGTTNLVSSHIHTQFLRVLSITARSSASLTTQLFKMNIVDITYLMLTGVSPPAGLDDVAQKIDSVVIMQALIHRPREQILETLNVICELLPSYKKESPDIIDQFFESAHFAARDPTFTKARKGPPPQRKIEALRDCKEELRRFALVLFPTLTDAYSSTVNLSVRQKVLVAQLKMLSNLEPPILEDALRAVPYASFLASILSQHDQLVLVVPALQAAEILLNRLGDIYRPQFHREGVVAEIRKLAENVSEPTDLTKVLSGSSSKSQPEGQAHPEGHAPPEQPPTGPEEATGPEDPDEDDDDDDDENENEEADDAHDDDSDSSGSEPPPEPPMPLSRMSLLKDLVGKLAQRFLEQHDKGEDEKARNDASDVLDVIQALTARIQDAFEEGDTKAASYGFAELARHFEGDALKSITSYELLASKMVTTLLDILQHPDGEPNEAARSAFIESFMNTSIRSQVKTAASDSPNTAFSVLVHKLQDLLSRAEHFEVITVYNQPMDSSRSSAASMLAKQIKIRLEADGESGIPPQYRNVMVSIHAIATFKALDDYLRPRISLAERPHGSRRRDLSSATQAASGSSGTDPVEASENVPAAQTPGAPGPATPSSQEPRKASKSKQAPLSSAAGQPPTDEPADQTSSGRRSARRTKSRPSPPRTPTSGSAEGPSQSQQTLECADENQLEDDEAIEDDEELNAIVGDLEDEAEEEAADPSAVNMEVASSGKVTALAEDGTRIATPTQSEHSSRTTSGLRTFSSEAARSLLGSLPSRPMSYSAAVQTTPQNWHLEFSVGSQSISNETTIYRAVHSNQIESDEALSRSIWSNLHVINYKRVEGPPTVSPITIAQAHDTVTENSTDLPQSLDKNPITASILRLLHVLHDINSSLNEISLNRAVTTVASEPPSQFVNTKLTAKLNRQLEEPLIVASSCLPTWSEDLARIYPFLFPFETRHLFLQSTSFGYSRSMARWQSAQQAADSSRQRHRDERPFLGRLQRQKVRISRRQILEAAIKVMELYGAYPHVLEIEYYEEVGTGLGPTLEFYSTVSREFSKKKLRLWRDGDISEEGDYAFGKHGLFPAPMSPTQAETENGKKILALFKALGKFVARSMLDSRIIDISFNPAFFKYRDDPKGPKPSIGSVQYVDSSLANSLQTLKQFLVAKKKIEEQTKLSALQKAQKLSRVSVGNATLEDMALNFTLPGYNIDLVPGGSNIDVTLANLESYIEKVIDFTMGEGVRRQIESFRSGFSQVFPYSALRAFTPDELVMLFGRNEEDWSLETLTDAVKADHGYNVDSKSVRNLLTIMSTFSPSKRRDFLQFVTGSPKLPIGGFKSLTPMFTVVCKPAEAPYSSDDYLPSVMTCVNYLKLPDYTTYEMMEKRLDVAIREGQGAFHLS